VTEFIDVLRYVDLRKPARDCLGLAQVTDFVEGSGQSVDRAGMAIALACPRRLAAAHDLRLLKRGQFVFDRPLQPLRH